MHKFSKLGLTAVLLFTAMLGSCANVKGESMQAIDKNGDGVYAVITTSRGDIVLSLEYQRTPLTVTNFVGLAEGTLNKTNPGKPFYDGLTFHRVINDFMIQGGDPQGTGSGGPGYQFADEFLPDLRFTQAGVLAMANAGPGTNGSQFFITHVPTTWLNGKHTIFGHVIAGQDVVKTIAQGDKMDKITIIRKGAEAEKFKPTQDSFNALEAKIEQKNKDAAKAEEASQMEQVDKLSKGAKTTASGIRYIVLKEGNGPTPKKGQTISANYEGRFINGQVFDSSYQRGEPIELPIGMGRVIPGWDEALLSMKVGEKRTIILPPEMAYGSRGAGGVIPPNAWLVFDVELVAIK